MMLAAPSTGSSSTGAYWTSLRYFLEGTSKLKSWPPTKPYVIKKGLVLGYNSTMINSRNSENIFFIIVHGVAEVDTSVPEC